jgi:hypothetical protein
VRRVHTYTSRPQYRRHVDAVWKHLPPEMRGTQVTRGTTDRLPYNDIVMVGGAVDFGAVSQQMIYVEHGAGQAYVDLKDDVSAHYHGGEHPPRVIGYICPNQKVADSWGRPAVAVGCPALDEIERKYQPTPKVAITFHWNAWKVCPEARSARDHYAEDLHTIVQWIRSDDMEPIGHWHPNDSTTKMMWDHLGVPTEPDPDVVLERANMLIVDNSSLGYEAAALGINVLWLNAPWYRRDVNHGLRFWDLVPGPQFEDVYDLVKRSPSYYNGHAGWISTADKMTKEVYTIDPEERRSGQVAADWIVELLSSL